MQLLLHLSFSSLCVKKMFNITRCINLVYFGISLSLSFVSEFCRLICNNPIEIICTTSLTNCNKGIEYFFLVGSDMRLPELLSSGGGLNSRISDEFRSLPETSSSSKQNSTEHQLLLRNLHWCNPMLILHCTR